MELDGYCILAHVQHLYHKHVRLKLINQKHNSKVTGWQRKCI